MDKAIIKGRLSIAHRQLKETKLGALIITKPSNVTYITGFTGDESWAIITSRAAYLITDSRYTCQALDECTNCRVIERVTALPEAAAKLLKKLKFSRTTAVETSTSVAGFAALKRHIKGGVKAVANVIETQRAVKDKSEVLCIKNACRIAQEALKQTRRYVKPGITENELAGRLDFQIRRLGVTNSFETIVAFGANAARPHHKPTTRRLKKNDSILVDFGARYKGYCCDLSRCFTIGSVSKLYKKAYDAVERAKAAAIKVIKPGVDIREVDAAARQVIKNFGLPVYGHGTGHGLGLEVHEAPFVSDKAEGELQAGMVFTVEPAVYIGGKLGVRLEEDCLVTRTGCKVLSLNCV